MEIVGWKEETMATTLSDITLSDVKSYYNYTETNRDTQITNLLPIVTDIITQYCRNTFTQTTRTNEKPVVPIERTDFYLKHIPVSSITSIIVDGTTLTEDTDFFVELDTGRVQKLSSDDPIFVGDYYWNSVPNKIVVTYVGGTPLTQDLVLVFYELVGIYAQINLKVYVDVEGNEHASKMDTIPAALKAILNRHQRVNI